MKELLLNLIFLYFLNFTVLPLIEEYLNYKLSERNPSDILWRTILKKFKNISISISIFLLDLIFLLILFIFSFSGKPPGILNILIPIFLLIFVRFFLNLSIVQFYSHNKLIKETILIIYSFLILILAVYTSYHLSASHYIFTNSFLVLTIFPLLFYINGLKLNKSEIFYGTEGGTMILASLNGYLIFLFNFLTILHFFNKSLTLFYISIYIFILRIVFYILNLIFIRFSEKINFLIFSISLIFISILNIIIKYGYK